MAKVTMTLYEALTKKKIYEDQLSKFDLRSKPIVGHYTKIKESINGVDLDTAANIMIGTFDSFIHLQKNILALQVAINKANLENTIVIPGYKNDQPITIVEAVTMNQRLDRRISYVNTIASKIKIETDYIEKENARISDPDYVYTQVTKQITPDKKSENSAEMLAQNIETFKKNNEVHLFDPNNLVENQWVEKEIEQINAFKAGLHTALMTANTKITLEVELED